MRMRVSGAASEYLFAHWRLGSEGRPTYATVRRDDHPECATGTASSRAACAGGIDNPKRGDDEG
jgi:hypothetical protein